MQGRHSRRGQSLALTQSCEEIRDARPRSRHRTQGTVQEKRTTRTGVRRLLNCGDCITDSGWECFTG